MKIAYHPSPDKGVSTLQYVGDAGEPYGDRARDIAIAVGVLALIWHFGVSKPNRRK